MSHRCTRKRRTPTENRRAVAAVEFAVCLPVLALIVFGTIELSNGIYAKQAGTAAAYEAARLATSIGGTEIAARGRADEVLTSMNIKGGVINVTPAVNAKLPRGTLVTVSVTIPADANSGGLSFLMPGRQINASVTMVKL